MPDFPPAVSITKLSELTIDVDKNWLTKNITNLGTGGHDLDVTLISLLAHAADKSCRVKNSAYENVADATFVVLSADGEDWDTDTMHDLVTNNSRITIKTAGKYLVWAQVRWDTNTTGVRGVYIRINGAYVPEVLVTMAATAAGYKGQQVVGLLDLAVNDYVETSVWQNSAATRTCKLDLFGAIRMV